MNRRLSGVSNPYEDFKIVCSNLGVSELIVRDKSRQTEKVKLRLLVWHELKTTYKWKISQIARFSNRSPSAISEFLKKYAHSNI